MTTIVKDTASKFAVAAVAVAMIFSAYAPAAQAQTTEDLQQMINDLLAQVAGLQSQLGGGSDVSAPAGAPGVCPYTWTRDLSQGSEGADVMKLQQFLNSYPDLRVAATGAGSMGMETMYYGPATAAAVSKMQVMFRAEVLTPNGLVNPTGYFGASSRSKANDLCIADTTTGGGDMDEDMDEEDDSSDMTLGGEGTLVTFEIDDEETEVSEGADDEVVMVLTLEAENGDIELSRMTFALTEGTDAPANEEQDPWDVFTEVSLWVDGDKVASFEADDEDEYLNEDAGTFRFSNIDLFLGEDEETEVLVAVSVMNSVDGSDVTDGADWAIEPLEVRYFDADGVASTETAVDEMETNDDAVPSTDESVEFDIEEAGTDDRADIESNSSNPDSATLLVDEDTDDSDEYVVHIFDIEVDRDSSDLEVGDAFVDVTITNANPAAAIAGGQEDVIDSIFMTIDGVTIEGEATTGGADDEDDAIALNGGTTTVEYRFEFDQDVTLETDEDYEVEISVVFKGQDGEYVNGVTIETDVDGSTWEVEGVENDDELQGSDSSEVHTLATVVPVITDTEFTVVRSEDGLSGTISFEFNVEADGENDVTLAFGDVTDVDGAADDVRFDITGGDLGANATASISKISGDATANGTTGWTIADGDDATFVIDVVFDAASATGAYRVYMDTIGGVEIDETSTALNI